MVDLDLLTSVRYKFEKLNLPQPEATAGCGTLLYVPCQTGHPQRVSFRLPLVVPA
jgi:hypothetical protein